MKIKDSVYGSFFLSSPVILELIASAPIQRLKKVSQMGPPDEFYHLPGYSRYVHSIGVMLLLKHLGAPEAEQVAGLIHDVSHTAFSHIIDWVIGLGQVESFQDDQHKEVVYKTEIISILRKYGLDPAYILDYHHFPLLEQNIPLLCADRIDYAIREFQPEIAQLCFRGLTTADSKIVYKDKKTAQVFGYNFLLRQKVHWAGYEAVTRYNLFAEALRIALHYKLISMDNFMGEESKIIDLLNNSNNRTIQKILNTLKSKDLSTLPKNKTVTRKKFRYVDPLYLDKGKLYQLSHTDPDFLTEINQARINNLNGIKAGRINAL